MRGRLLWGLGQATFRGSALAVALMGCLVAAAMTPAWAAVAAGPGGNEPDLTITAPNPPSGPPGTLVAIKGTHWVSVTTVTFTVSPPGGTCTADASPLAGIQAATDANGTFTTVFHWPTLGPGIYHLCGIGQGAPAAGILSVNTFTQEGQGPVSLTLPSSAAVGTTVSVTGQNWFPPGTVVELRIGSADSDGCTTALTTLTSGDDGSITGTFSAPTTPGDDKVTATYPAGTCNGTVAPTLQTAATLAVTAAATTPGSGTPNPGTPNPGTPSPGTPAPGTPGAGTSTPAPGGPGQGTATPTQGAATPTATPSSGLGTAVSGTATPGSSLGTPVSGTATPCPAGRNCGPAPAPGPSLPYLPLCLALLVLLALLLLLFLLLIRRRNEEIIVTEEDITSQINTNAIAPMGAMRFVRAVRVTTQVSDRRTGAVRRSQSHDFDEFQDASGATHRRQRRTP